MFAAAAGLWLVYLMPTWFKRREYLATERNAVRLQQTLRVLAETAEVPTAVRVETSARSVAEQERLLREHQRKTDAITRSRDAQLARVATERADAERARQLAIPTGPAASRNPSSAASASSAASTVASPTAAPTGAYVPVAAASSVGSTGSAPSRPAILLRRLRRTRAAASLLTLAGVVAIVAQIVVSSVAGAGPAAGLIIGFAAIASLTGVAALLRLSSVARRRIAPPVRVAVKRNVRMSPPLAKPEAAAPAAPAQPWTPVPIPKPMYLSRSLAADVAPAAPVVAGVAGSSAAAVDSSLVASTADGAAPAAASVTEQAGTAEPAAAQPGTAEPVDHAAELRAAAAEADAALRAAQQSPEVTPITSAGSASSASSASASEAAPSAPAAPSRFASMGLVESTDAASTDLDAVLRRRRAAS